MGLKQSVILQRQKEQEAQKEIPKEEIKVVSTEPEETGEDKKTRIRVVRFSITDIAKTKEVTNSAVHKATFRGTVKPRDLESLSKYVLKRKGDTICRLCGQPLKKEKI